MRSGTAALKQHTLFMFHPAGLVRSSGNCCASCEAECRTEYVRSWLRPGEAAISNEGRQASEQTSRATPVACNTQATTLSVSGGAGSGTCTMMIGTGSCHLQCKPKTSLSKWVLRHFVGRQHETWTQQTACAGRPSVMAARGVLRWSSMQRQLC